MYNSLWPSDAIWCRRFLSSLIQVMLPIWCQAITWTITDFLPVGPNRTHFNEILITIQTFSFRIMHLKMLSAICLPFCSGLNVISNEEISLSAIKTSSFLTLNMRGPSYLGLTKSISWLLMPWLLTSPGHQQPWYWLYRICRSLSYLRKCFKYLCQVNVEEWHKAQINVYVPSEKFCLKGLTHRGQVMHQQTRPSLIQIMACCLFSAEPLPELMVAHI